MIRRALLVLILSLMSGAAAWCAAPAMQTVAVTVVNEHVKPAQAVPSARVTLWFFDGSQKITEAQERTNRFGQTELQVPVDVLKEQRELRIEISDAPGLVMYRPGEGLFVVLPKTMRIVLLPAGSPELLEPAQIQLMLKRLSGLVIEVKQLNTKVDKLEKEKPQFEVALRNWATENGLPFEEVDRQVKTWSQKILDHRAEHSLEEQAEAELGARQYGKASEDFRKISSLSFDEADEMTRQQKETLVKLRQVLRSGLDSAWKSVTSSQSGGDFNLATHITEESKERVEKIYQSNSGDAEIRKIWVRSNLMNLLARWYEGRQSLAQESATGDSTAMFVDVTRDCKKLLGEISQKEDPESWPYIHIMLVVSTMYLSESSDGPSGARLRAEAVEESRAALAAFDPKENPTEWANAEELLGLMLMMKVVRGVTDEKPDFAEAERQLEESRASFVAAQRIFTKAEHPDEWAKTEASLGDLDLLGAQLKFAQGAKSTELLPQAEAEYRAALAVINEKADPKDWAYLQHDLAETLATRANSSEGPGTHELWQQAIAAFRSGAAAISKTENPIKWANEEGSLGLALKDAGSAAGDEDAAELFRESVEAYRAQLSVFSKASFPQRWAKGQQDLGEALADEAMARNSEKSIALAEEAVTAFKAALEVYTKEGYPQRWPMAEANLATALANVGARTTGDESLRWKREALDAYKALLDPFPKSPAVLQALGTLYHEDLIDFPKAYDFMGRLETVQPSDGNQLNLAEAALTDGKFQECVTITSGLDESKLEKQYLPVRRTLLFACQWGGGEHAAAAKTADALLAIAPELPRHGWTTRGDRVYLAGASEFKSQSADWVRLFQALEVGDSDGFAASVQALKVGAGH